MGHRGVVSSTWWAASTVAIVVATMALLSSFVTQRSGMEGRDDATLAGQSVRAGVEAYMLRESYAPGMTAVLVVDSALRRVTVQIFRTGELAPAGTRRDEMRGVPVTEPRRVSLVARSGRRMIRIGIGDWPSGVYYAELRSGSRVGYAPFVVAPRTLGEHRVAVVMPTNTWAAYNRRDADADGEGDTWYENWSIKSIDTSRPFLDRGVPPNFGRYDLPFLHWLASTGKAVDVLSQRELESANGDGLARAYDLIVFPGHHEYVTEGEYDAVERFRDLGGNLAFLSANNFFWKVIKRGDRMLKVKQWRDLGRPEAALIGVQYIGNDRGQHRGPFQLRKSRAGAWLFAGTGLVPGSSFGSFGIEIDHTARFSPRGIEVVAEIRDLFAPGKTAQMTYYETPRGARVFAAGSFTLAGNALEPPVSSILENLWQHLTSQPPDEKR